MTTQTATLTDIRVATLDGVCLLLARCDRCLRDVMHGGGSDPMLLLSYMGHREAHCGCPDGYTITDPDNVLVRRAVEIINARASATAAAAAGTARRSAR
jgi:hypothetical protein